MGGGGLSVLPARQNAQKAGPDRVNGGRGEAKTIASVCLQQIFI